MSGGIELGGNKIRKLEFLLADALSLGRKSVITIGGEQSNHCRATASACRLLGLVPHLILRSGRRKEEEEFGLVGNVLVDRMVGSRIYTCTTGEYGRIGSNNLIERLCRYLQEEEDTIAYPIPVGGSNGLGTWGYIEGVNEIMHQIRGDKNEEGDDLTLDHVLLATGSGGTAAGITLGMALSHGTVAEQQQKQKAPKIHAVGVCDNPDYFYNEVSKIANEMGFTLPTSSSCTTLEELIHNHLIVHQGKGLGYARSTAEELNFCTQFAIETGIVLDPVYSGKALYHFVTTVLEEDPEAFRDSNVLFWHTGGALGMYEKSEELMTHIGEVSSVKRLDVYHTEKKKGGGTSGSSNSVPI